MPEGLVDKLRMITARLIGGLGNQLFQYAAARALSKRLGATLRLDCSGFAQYQLRRYRLDHFSINAIDTGCRQGRLLPPRLVNWLCRASGSARRGNLTYRERQFTFDPAVLALPDDVYLDGYWQSERYFKDFESLIRRELTVRTPPSAQNREVLAVIATAPTVSIHVRRGDYISNPLTARVHGACEPQYYAQAARFIAQRVGQDPDCFVFSDDITWSRNNIRVPFRTHYVDHNPPDMDYEDLRLMSACRHHIIANSTFSWWGAWLGSAPEKIVVAPKRWFLDPSLDDRDLIPVNWFRL